MRASHRAAVLAFLVCILAAVNISATTLVVTKTEDTNDGACDADCSLREAVAAAAPDDGIVFSALFYGPQTITLTLGQIAITRNLTITGTGRDLLTVSGNDLSRIFNISGGVVVSLSGMKLQNGRVGAMHDFTGGAIRVSGGSLTLTDMILTNNVAAYIQPPFNDGLGGALAFFDNCSVTVVNSIISNNTAQSAAGIFAETGTLDVRNSIISGNSSTGIGSSTAAMTVTDSTLDANRGRAISVGTGTSTSITRSIITNNTRGGVGGGDGLSTLVINHSVIDGNLNISLPNSHAAGILNSGTAQISNCLISNNRATGRGGGIYNTGTIYVEGTAVIGNRAQLSGGGAFNSSGVLYITNSTFSGNIGVQSGGGIHNLITQGFPTSRVFLTNATIAFNSSNDTGGGLRLDLNGSATFQNSIVANNSSISTGPDVYGEVKSQGFNMIGTTTGSQGWLQSDHLNVDPLLAPLGNNGGPTQTHALRPKSPAINSGSNDLARDPLSGLPLAYDQRGSGFLRILGGSVDIGAHESNIATMPVNIYGRILSNEGRGLSGAIVVLTSEMGLVQHSVSNPFGYYRFFNLTPGATYTISVNRKFYSFSQYVFTAEQDRNDLNIIGSL